MSPTPIHRRHRYFVEKEFQLKFIGEFCLLVILGSLIAMAVVYWLARHSTTVAIVHGHVAVRTTADYLVPVLIQTVIVQMIIVAAAAFMMTLYLSNKIAGPLYRLKMMFKALGEGDVSQPMRVREDDQLKGVADGYTEAVGHLSDRIRNVKEAAARNDLQEVKKILDTIKTS